MYALVEVAGGNQLSYLLLYCVAIVATPGKRYGIIQL